MFCSRISDILLTAESFDVRSNFFSYVPIALILLFSDMLSVKKLS